MGTSGTDVGYGAKQDWRELADPKMIYWCAKLNAISGIETRQSCSGHRKGDISKSEGVWGYETNANLWFICDWITDNIALRLAKIPTMERVRKVYHSDGEIIWDLSFAGNNKGKLDKSIQAILETLIRSSSHARDGVSTSNLKTSLHKEGLV